MFRPMFVDEENPIIIYIKRPGIVVPSCPPMSSVHPFGIIGHVTSFTPPSSTFIGGKKNRIISIKNNTPVA